MFDLDNWQEIMNSLTRSPLRTILTALGVFWGIFMLIIMLGAAKGLENGVRDDMGGRATNSLYIWTQVTTKPYQGLKAGRSFRMNNDDYFAFKQLLPEAEYICPRNQLGNFGGGNGVTRGNKSGEFEVTGDYPDIQQVELFDVYEGRFLNMNDIWENRKVAVIGQRVRDILFERDEEPIGDYIQVNGTYFLVVGVFKSRQSGMRGERETQRVYVPFTTFQRAFNYGNSISWFAMTAPADGSAMELEAKALQILKKRHTVHPEDERAFGHFNMEEGFQEIETIFFGMRWIGWIVGAFTLLAGAIGISNIMLVSVKERTKEFGIRRAVGARPGSIIGQVIAEAITLTLLSGYFGLLLGVGLLELVGYFIENSDADMGMFGSPTIDIGLALRALMILVFAGILAGLIPAQRAVRVRPVEALRAE
jgi:putative ABC transport system permease protein